MKRLLFCALTIVFLLSFSYANATLIGVSLSGLFPDVQFDNTGTASFTKSTGHFQITADDRDIAYSGNPLDKDTLTLIVGSDIWWRTQFTISLYVNAVGQLDTTKPAWMEEKVIATSTHGKVSVKGVEYNVGDVLLRGQIKAFGWADDGTGKPVFDFLIDNSTITGGFVTQGIWNTAYDTGITSTPDAAAIPSSPKWYTWSADWSVGKVKGDKAPLVPEPGTLILLGAGLVGLAGYGKFRLGRKKR